jgi:hypothetical protein
MPTGEGRHAAHLLRHVACRTLTVGICGRAAAARCYSVASAAFRVADGRITASVAAASGW